MNSAQESENILICPVPTDQRPLEEYISFKRSWFFSIPLNNNHYPKVLFASWSLSFPFTLLISTGSVELNSNLPRLLFASIISAFVVPLLISIRLHIGWNYILQRLLLEDIQYEKSGWYDGKIWKKTKYIKEKDFLIGQHEVMPIIRHIKIGIISTTIIPLIGILAFNII